MTDRGLIIAALLIAIGLGLNALSDRWKLDTDSPMIVDSWTGKMCFPNGACR